MEGHVTYSGKCMFLALFLSRHGNSSKLCAYKSSHPNEAHVYLTITKSKTKSHLSCKMQITASLVKTKLSAFDSRRELCFQPHASCLSSLSLSHTTFGHTEKVVWISPVILTSWVLFLFMYFWQQSNQITSYFNLCINSDPIYISQQSFLLVAGLLIASLQGFPPWSSRTSGIWLPSRFHLAGDRHFQFCSTLAELKLCEERERLPPTPLKRHTQNFVYTV